nr:MAG TPA: hypothetical protein [Caudoviricetes sp.]
MVVNKKGDTKMKAGATVLGLVSEYVGSNKSEDIRMRCKIFFAYGFITFEMRNELVRLIDLVDRAESVGDFLRIMVEAKEFDNMDRAARLDHLAKHGAL